jgi:ribosome-associated translation inhibitor RaiA
MQLPLQIHATHHVTLSPDIETEIREKAAHLENYYDRIMGCRVVVEAPVRHHRLGAFSVRIDLTVPGEELVVSKQERPDLKIAVRDAFDAIRRQLEDFVRRQRGD